MVTFAHLCCLYLDAQSVLAQNLSGLVDLQKGSLDSVPGLAANSDEDLEAKGEELDQICEWDRQPSTDLRCPLQRLLLSPSIFT